MPFKTRQRKISASEHRYGFYDSPTVNYGGEGLTESTAIVKTKRSIVDKSSDDYGMVRSDLVKTAVLAFIVIAGQIVIRTFLKI